jgi:type IV pilus biogenesis protein CpaD/CtpE
VAIEAGELDVLYPGLRVARVVAGLGVLGAVTLALTACSPGADYPAVLDRPEPRAEQTMNPAEVKQATDALILDRDRLSATTQQQQQQASAPATTGSTRTTTGTTPKP